MQRLPPVNLARARRAATGRRAWPVIGAALRPLALAGALAGLGVSTATAEPVHAIAMHGTPKYATDFTHLDYVNADAPRGGTLRLHAVGTFDTLNPLVIKGVPAAGLGLSSGWVFEPLMRRSQDEPFSLYGLIAETAEMPDDRAWIEFTLRAEARFADGTPITAEDVIFSLETLRTKGRPNARATWARVAHVAATGPRRVRFTFADNRDRELPLLVAGFLPILSKRYWAGRDFTATTLEAPLGSGPYRVARATPGRSIEYRRNPNYWAGDLPISRGQFNFDVIRFDYYRDANIALEAFKAGDYDIREEHDPTRWTKQYDFPAARDGRVVVRAVDYRLPSGLAALAFNLRRAPFADRRVRAALVEVFDFEWLNRALFHGLYVRTRSMFDNSSLAPAGPPTPGEQALLAPWRDQLPGEVFGTAYVPPVSDGSGHDRRPLRAAQQLLTAAGWTVRDGVLRNAAGAALAFEILLQRPANQRVALAYARNLARLGIAARVRLAEAAQYQALIGNYEFDMVFANWGVSLSPGNEQQNYWSSKTANAPGGRNVAGVADAAVDALIAAVVAARTRGDLVTATRALDRVLMANRYVVPLYHRRQQWIAHWRRIAMPATTPLPGVQFNAMWAVE